MELVAWLHKTLHDKKEEKEKERREEKEKRRKSCYFCRIEISIHWVALRPIKYNGWLPMKTIARCVTLQYLHLKKSE